MGVDGLEPPMSETADLQSAAIATMRYPHRCSIILVSYGIEYPVYFIVTVQAQDSVVSVPLKKGPFFPPLPHIRVGPHMDFGSGSLQGYPIRPYPRTNLTTDKTGFAYVGGL